MITALYGVLDPSDGSWTYATAGHPPAVVRTAEGETRLLADDCDPPLGFAKSFRVRHAILGPGATLLLYTDGLIERRSEPLDVGLARVLEACHVAQPEPDALCDSVLETMLKDAPIQDDVALVAVRLEK